MTTRDVTTWLKRVQAADDTFVARELLDTLIGYRRLTNTEAAAKSDLDWVLALIEAIRLDQMAKENA